MAYYYRDERHRRDDPGAGMEIRRVRPGEAGRLRELRLRALEDAPRQFFSSLQAERELPAGYWESWAGGEDGKAAFVAVEDGPWLGLAAAFLHPEKAATASLWWGWVAPAARGRGLGRRLLEAGAGWARRHGAARLELAVAETNETAVQFCRGLGFVPTGERRSMASDPTRVGVFMARPVGPVPAGPVPDGSVPNGPAPDDAADP